MNKMNEKKIGSGVYVVVDPAMERNAILKQLEKIKDENLAAVQIWDNFSQVENPEGLFDSIIQIFQHTETPVLINNQWETLKKHAFDGIHFDGIPLDMVRINEDINRPFMKGITLTNDLHVAEKAEELRFDYLSFCSVFPSETSNSCELVSFESIKKCKEITSMPIFLSGGITPDNITSLKEVKFAGIAVVSGVMKAVDPVETLRKYKQKLTL